MRVVGSLILPVTTFSEMWSGDILNNPNKAAGDFAAAIVTAHEMGHHAQNEIGSR